MNRILLTVEPAYPSNLVVTELEDPEVRKRRETPHLVHLIVAQVELLKVPVVRQILYTGDAVAARRSQPSRTSNREIEGRYRFAPCMVGAWHMARKQSHCFLQYSRYVAQTGSVGV